MRSGKNVRTKSPNGQDAVTEGRTGRVCASAELRWKEMLERMNEMFLAADQEGRQLSSYESMIAGETHVINEEKSLPFTKNSSLLYEKFLLSLRNLPPFFYVISKKNHSLLRKIPPFFTKNSSFLSKNSSFLSRCDALFIRG